ncbi:hypothetical protein HYS96_03560 [Candidatus Daviesbacteria bacterium]|nr:hypothetical protein [Candidatus Daviesbacteria bacterium]
MERDTFTPDNPEANDLNRQAELLWGLTVEIQRNNLPSQIIGGLRLICLGAYRRMMNHGEQGWADRILEYAQSRHPTHSQNIQGQEVADATH